MMRAKRKTTGPLAFALAAAAILLTPHMVQAQSVPPILNNEILARNSIKNFEQVNSGLLRGAVPGDKNLEILARSGVKTIVDLRKPSRLVDRESRKARELGLEYVHIPLGFTSPDQGEMTRVLALVADERKQPVFVHCRQGADRTGMTIGMYRRIHDNWAFEPTYEEMRRHHFKPFLLGMKSAVKTCPVNQAFVSAINPSSRASNLKVSENSVVSNNARPQ